MTLLFLSSKSRWSKMWNSSFGWLFKKLVSVISSCGVISVIQVRCSHGTPVGEHWSEWSSRSSTFVVALASEAPPWLAKQTESRRPRDTWCFSSSPILITEITVWNQNTREVRVSPLSDCLSCSRGLNTHQHNSRNPRQGGKHVGSSWAKGH